MPRSKITYVVAAFNAADTIDDTLRSIFGLSVFGTAFPAEAVVVDDGGDDYERLAAIVSRYPNARLLRHERNRGMCAARNTGIDTATGDLIAILDADDKLVADWSSALLRVLKAWPAHANVCFTACVNQRGEPTVEHPQYQGWYTFEDAMRARHTGEYMPIFDATYIKARRYRDLRISKSCGTLSYLQFLQDGPFWISSEILRIYTDNRAGSVSNTWAEARRARESAVCLEALLAEFGPSYLHYNPYRFSEIHLKLAVYRRLAGLRGAWSAWRKAVGPMIIGKSMITAAILFAPPALAVRTVGMARRLGLLKRYG